MISKLPKKENDEVLKKQQQEERRIPTELAKTNIVTHNPLLTASSHGNITKHKDNKALLYPEVKDKLLVSNEPGYFGQDKFLKKLDKALREPNKFRPWSVKGSIFTGQPSISLKDVLLGLNVVDFNSFPKDFAFDKVISNCFTDDLWRRYNEKFNLPKGFLESHNNVDLVERSDERLLPLWPISPGPFALSKSNSLCRPTADPALLHRSPFDAWVYNKVTSFGVPNYRGARIQINTRLDFHIWHRLLKGYNDFQVLDFMAYGWPIGFHSNVVPKLSLPNHMSSLNHPKEVDKYIEKELSHGALVGPFKSDPFKWLRINPLMVRPKKEEGKFRVILDLSFPDLESVNSWIPRFSFDGAPYKLRLPSALDLAGKIAKFGQNCYLYKLDLQRAYRQLPVNPLDWALLGYEWNGNLYFDKSIPFGLRHGAMNCERVTCAICYAAAKEVEAELVAFIDDLGGAAPDNLQLALQHYQGVCRTIEKLGLILAPEKCEGPRRILTWTGTTYNSITMIMSIDQSKIEETLELVRQVIVTSKITLKEMKVLLGKLQHSIKLCPGGRCFLNRLLGMRKDMSEVGLFPLTDGAKEDLIWFIRFLEVFNGKAVIRSLFTPNVILFVDACLVGGGSLWEGETFSSFKWSDDVLSWGLAINELELFNVLIALRIWKDKLSGKTVRIWCDNSSSVRAMFSGKTHNTFMASCLRELWWISCTADIFLGCDHVPGKENDNADVLSRAFVSGKDWLKFEELVEKTHLPQTKVDNTNQAFPNF